MDLNKFANIDYAGPIVEILTELLKNRDYTKSPDQLLYEYSKPEYRTYGGYGYKYQNENLSGVTSDVIKDSATNLLSSAIGGNNAGGRLGAQIGSAFGEGGETVGKYLGGAIGSAAILPNVVPSFLSNISKMKKAKKEALEIAYRNNVFNEGQAKHKYAMDLFNEQYKPNTSNLYLDHAYNGKDRVNTASGIRNKKQNAWVSKGEYIYDGDNLSKVNRGSGDTAPAYLKGKDVVFTNNPNIPAPVGFKTIAQAVPYAAATGQLEKLAAYQKQMHDMGYYNGKDMNAFYDGKDLYSSGLFSALLLAAARQYSKSKETPRLIDVNVPNLYEEYAINKLKGLNISEDPIYRKILNLGRSAWNDIRLSGGMTGSQKRRARLQLMLNTQQSLADAGFNAQTTKNALNQSVANSIYNMANQTAQNRMRANMFNEPINQKALIQPWLGEQESMRTGINALQRAAEDSFKKHQFELMYNLYSNRIDQNALDALKVWYDKQKNEQKGN